jgi:hypothetical protein
MSFRLSAKKPYGLQTSPWIVLGSTAILLVVVLVLAIANTNREKRYMAQVLKTKGAALIQAVEAGARTGMAGMMWRGQEVQRLLEETARLPDVLFMAVVDRNGRVVAHSDQNAHRGALSPRGAPAAFRVRIRSKTGSWSNAPRGSVFLRCIAIFTHWTTPGRAKATWRP